MSNTSTTPTYFAEEISIEERDAALAEAAKLSLADYLQHIENMKIEHTRADYRAGNCTHDEFYAQFVTPAILELVKSQIGEAKIKKSEDPNFNDIPLARWDILKDGIFLRLDKKKFKRLCSPDAPAGVMSWSFSDSICIAKEAARQVKNN